MKQVLPKTRNFSYCFVVSVKNPEGWRSGGDAHRGHQGCFVDAGNCGNMEVGSSGQIKCDPKALMTSREVVLALGKVPFSSI